MKTDELRLQMIQLRGDYETVCQQNDRMRDVICESGEVSDKLRARVTELEVECERQKGEREYIAEQCHAETMQARARVAELEVEPKRLRSEIGRLGKEWGITAKGFLDRINELVERALAAERERDAQRARVAETEEVLSRIRDHLNLGSYDGTVREHGINVLLAMINGDDYDLDYQPCPKCERVKVEIGEPDPLLDRAISLLDDMQSDDDIREADSNNITPKCEEAEVLIDEYMDRYPEKTATDDILDGDIPGRTDHE